MAALQLLRMEQPFFVVASCPAPGKPCNPARSALTIRVNAKHMEKLFRTSKLYILASGQLSFLGFKMVGSQRGKRCASHEAPIGDRADLIDQQIGVFPERAEFCDAHPQRESVAMRILIDLGGAGNHYRGGVASYSGCPIASPMPACRVCQVLPCGFAVRNPLPTIPRD